MPSNVVWLFALKCILRHVRFTPDLFKSVSKRSPAPGSGFGCVNRRLYMVCGSPSVRSRSCLRGNIVGPCSVVDVWADFMSPAADFFDDGMDADRSVCVDRVVLACVEHCDPLVVSTAVAAIACFRIAGLFLCGRSDWTNGCSVGLSLSLSSVVVPVVVGRGRPDFVSRYCVYHEWYALRECSSCSLVSGTGS